MTDVASTGLTPLPENLRPVSVRSGIIQAKQDTDEAFVVAGVGVSVIENFRSGEDKVVLPQGTDLSHVTVVSDWHDDAWGLRISYGAGGGDSVFLRWGWKFDAAEDLIVAGSEIDTPPDPGTDDAVGEVPPTHGDTGEEPPTAGGTDVGTGTDTLVLNVSSESYKGDAQFTVHVNGTQVGDAFIASAGHGLNANIYTLRGDWGGNADVTVTFLNDLWGGTAETDRNLHINSAILNGETIAAAPQTVWGSYGVSFSAGGTNLPDDDGEKPPIDDGALPPTDGGEQTPGSTSNPDGEVNVLIRGQSNAQLFTAWGGANELERVLEAELGTNVNILAAYETGDGHNSINSATRFMDWAQDGLQQGLISFLNDQPASIKDNPTLTVWMHNEYDQQSDGLTTDQWVSAVREDAELVRDALGQDASTTPYEFVAIRYPYGGNFEAIANGMEALAADGTFHAGTSETATDAVMDGDGFANSSHMGAADAQQIGRELGQELAAVLAPLTGSGGGNDPVQEEPPVDDSDTDPGNEPPSGGNNGGTPGTMPEGYTLVLADDFSNGYSYENWGTPFNGGTYWNGAFTWNADDVGVRNGEMQVTITDQGGWWTAGGFNSFKAGNTITYGKVEFDAKVPNEQGTMAAILTWPASDTWPADGEIDILETPHDENMFSTHFEGPNGEHWYDSVRSSTYDAAQWNHYEVTWLPDRLTIEVNGQVMAEWTDPAEIPSTAHGFGAMGFVGTELDEWMGGAPDGSTPDIVTISLDNVRMFQADGIF